MVQIRHPWNFQDLYEELDRMTRNFSRVFDTESCLAAGPETGLRLSDHDAVLVLDLPGVKEADLNLALENNRVRIEARREDAVRDGEDVVLRERSYGEFTREYRLPWPVEEDKIEAEFARGVLRVRLPRAPETKPRRIPVNVNA